tara:strand:- start:122 stop:433 length:312 start_codon:yes stop_codon:yes gene_type:complete
MTVKFVTVENEKSFHDDMWCVHILEGKYQDVIYQYDVINVSDEDIKNGRLNFSFISIENPNNLDLTMKEFHNTIGDILTELIEGYFAERDKQDRTSSTQASTQ